MICHSNVTINIWILSICLNPIIRNKILEKLLGEDSSRITNVSAIPNKTLESFKIKLTDSRLHTHLLSRCADRDYLNSARQCTKRRVPASLRMRKLRSEGEMRCTFGCPNSGKGVSTKISFDIAYIICIFAKVVPSKKRSIGQRNVSHVASPLMCTSTPLSQWP